MKNLKTAIIQAILLLTVFNQFAIAQLPDPIQETLELECPGYCLPNINTTDDTCYFELSLQVGNTTPACPIGNPPVNQGMSQVDLKHHYKGPGNGCEADLDRDRTGLGSGEINYKLCSGEVCNLSQANFPSPDNGDVNEPANGFQAESPFPYRRNPMRLITVEPGTAGPGNTTTSWLRPRLPRDPTKGQLLDPDCEAALTVRIMRGPGPNEETIWYEFHNVLELDVDITLKARCGCANDNTVEDISFQANLDELKTALNKLESFEDGMGSWQQVSTDNADWVRSLGATPSNLTGPSNAFHEDYFMYIEASGNGFPSKTAGLINPSVPLAGIVDPEIRFKSHMYGSDMGTLTLQARFTGNQQWTNLWSQSGDQGDSWEEVIVSLAAFEDSVIDLRFMAITGNGYRGDMAIDYIEIAPPIEEIVTSNCVAPINAFPYTENFNNNALGLLSKDSITANWNIIDLNQITAEFPSTIDGQYLYMRRPNWDGNSTYKAGLISPCIDFNSLDNPELFFRYVMNHSNDSLIVKFSEDEGQTWHSLLNLTGDQGNTWNEQYLDVSNISNSNKVMFMIIGHAGTGSTALALDHFEIRDHNTIDCESLGFVSSLMWLDAMQLGAFNWSSGNNGGYGDYTHTTIPLSDSMDISIIPDFATGLEPELGLFCNVWIDFNQDGDFDDIGELALQQEKHPFLRGDANNDGLVNMSDIIYIYNVLFQGTGHFVIPDAADVNDDGMVNISDGIFLSDFLFAGTVNTLPAPYPIAGWDPTNNDIEGRIDVPSNALPGMAKMRIQVKAGNYASNACETFPLGEVEDYTVEVLNSGQAKLSSEDPLDSGKSIDLKNANSEDFTSTEETLEKELLVNTYPNPSDGIVSISVEGPVSGFSYKVSNVIGQVVEQPREVLGQTTSIDLSNLPKGIYMVMVQAGTQQITNKIIVR